MNVIKFEKNFVFKPYLTITLLGKNYKLIIKYTSSESISLTRKDNEFILSLPKKYKNSNNNLLISTAINKLYTEVAPKEIEDSLELARHILKFAPEDYKIQRISTGFYKSLKRKILIINPDIIKYNKDIINTTMIQEFCKMKYNARTKIYKSTLKKALDDYENYKQCLKNEVKYKIV